MDEPTTGLHAADIDRLLGIVDRLIAGGNTVVVIEHNLDVIAAADRIVDLGPEGGKDGGAIVAEGTPETVADHQAISHTGRYLKERLAEPAVRTSGGSVRVASAGAETGACMLDPPAARVGADLLGTEAIRGTVEVAGEPRDGLDVRALGERRQPSHLHVFEHALTKGCHQTLLGEGHGGFQALAEQRRRGSRGAAAVGRSSRTRQ